MNRGTEMNYTLFDEFILLQSLLKDLGIIPSGGAIKEFLAENTVLFNGEREMRRRKKLRVGDQITIPDQNLTITLVEASPAEKETYLADLVEKKRVQALVKKMNQEQKKTKSATKSQAKKKPVRFPGV